MQQIQPRRIATYRNRSSRRVAGPAVAAAAGHHRACSDAQPLEPAAPRPAGTRPGPGSGAAGLPRRRPCRCVNAASTPPPPQLPARTHRYGSPAPGLLAPPNLGTGMMQIPPLISTALPPVQAPRRSSIWQHLTHLRPSAAGATRPSRPRMRPRTRPSRRPRRLPEQYARAPPASAPRRRWRQRPSRQPRRRAARAAWASCAALPARLYAAWRRRPCCSLRCCRWSSPARTRPPCQSPRRAVPSWRRPLRQEAQRAAWSGRSPSCWRCGCGRGWSRVSWPGAGALLAGGLAAAACHQRGRMPAAVAPPARLPHPTARPRRPRPCSHRVGAAGGPVAARGGPLLLALPRLRLPQHLGQAPGALRPRAGGAPHPELARRL